MVAFRALKNLNQVTAMNPVYHKETIPSKSVRDLDLTLFAVGTFFELGTGHGSAHNAMTRYTKRCSIPDRDAGREGDPEKCFCDSDSNQDIS